MSIHFLKDGMDGRILLRYTRDAPSNLFKKRVTPKLAHAITLVSVPFMMPNSLRTLE